MKYRILFFLIIPLCYTGRAQSVKREFIIEQKIHTGMNLPLYKALDYLIRDDIYAGDISIRFPSRKKDFWDKFYHYPVTGAGFLYWSLGNNEVFGHAAGLYGFIALPFARPGTKWTFNYQISTGAAYLSKIFDVAQNHLNRAIGAHMNIYMRLSADARYRFSENSEIIIEAGASHFSNGKTRSPNYGINAGTVSLGINYRFNPAYYEEKEERAPSPEKKYLQTLTFSAGSKVCDNLFGKKYFASSLSYDLQRCFNVKRRAGGGIDLFYDGSIRESMADENGIPDDNLKDLMRAGLHGTYSQRFRKIEGVIQMGGYFYTKYRGFSNIYHRISLNYILTDRFSAHIGIKSHWGKADLLEYGIAYNW